MNPTNAIILIVIIIANIIGKICNKPIKAILADKIPFGHNIPISRKVSILIKSIRLLNFNNHAHFIAIYNWTAIFPGIHFAFIENNIIEISIFKVFANTNAKFTSCFFNKVSFCKFHFFFI